MGFIWLRFYKPTAKGIVPYFICHNILLLENVADYAASGTQHY